MASNIQNGYPLGYPQTNPGTYNPNMLNNPQPTPYTMAPQPPKSINMQWVQGIGAAKSFMIEPNSTMPLWDSEANKIYIKTTDIYGRTTGFKVLHYEIEDVMENGVTMDNFVTKDQFNSIIKEINDVKELIRTNNAAESTINQQSNAANSYAEPNSFSGIQGNQYAP